MPGFEMMIANDDQTVVTAYSKSPGSDSIDLAIHAVVEDSIEQLYRNVYDMQSTDHSPSKPGSFTSYGEESIIDSELRHLIGEEFEEIKTRKDEGVHKEEEEDGGTKQQMVTHDANGLSTKSKKTRKHSAAAATIEKRNRNLLILCRDNNPQRALKSALRAVKSYEEHAEGKPSLELVMCLHVLARIQSRLGHYSDSIQTMERAIQIPSLEKGRPHALAKFAGCMQLGDTYAALGQSHDSILCYTAGLEIQMQVLGENDSRLGKTCRYVAEANVQAMRLDEAERLCQIAINIHGQNRNKSNGGNISSLEEAEDRILMGNICNAKGNYKGSLEHYVLASMNNAANGNEANVAAIDRSIGDAYLGLARFDEALCAYEKALASFKLTKGDNHHGTGAVASVYVRMANLYSRIGKFKESRSYCSEALQILKFAKTGISAEDRASGLIEISSIYQSFDESDRAMELLVKAQRILSDAPGKQSATVAGMEAQIGVIFYMIGNYTRCYETLRTAISKLKANGEKRGAMLGMALNQMGLACVQLNSINEAADLFEEARGIFEKEFVPYHHQTLAVYSNLAATYDAMGRLDDAIEILDHIVAIREEKLGTANPDVDDEKCRLLELLKESGKIRSTKFKSLESLLHKNSSQ